MRWWRMCEVSNNDSFEYHVNRVLRDAVRTEYAQCMNTLCTRSYNVVDVSTDRQIIRDIYYLCQVS